VARGGLPLRLVVTGELDLATIERLQSILGRARAEGAAVVIDLARVEFIDVAGLDALIRAQRTAADQGWDLSFLPRVSEPVERLLGLLGEHRDLVWHDA